MRKTRKSQSSHALDANGALHGVRDARDGNEANHHIVSRTRFRKGRDVVFHFVQARYDV